jgi:iron complex transport system ATP-binding protein
MIGVRGLNYSIGSNRILVDISCVFQTGLITGVIGANGSGKSTLLKHIYRELISKNTVFFGDTPVERLSDREGAHKMAVLLQENQSVPVDFSVGNLVVMGRYSRKKLTETYDANDERLVIEALRLVKLEELKTRRFSSLSGGEKQLALLARALCQDTPVLILDEPVNHLDIRHQLSLMEILTSQKKTTIIALHDLNLAAMYCDRLILLDKGHIASQGTPQKVLTEQNILNYFGVNAKVNFDENGRPVITIKKYNY